MLPCCNCERYRTKDCRPDKCITINEQGDFKYNLFRDYHSNPAKFCELCGARLTRRRSNGKEFPELRHTDLECPEHGIVGVQESQYRSKVRTAKKAPA